MGQRSRRNGEAPKTYDNIVDERYALSGEATRHNKSVSIGRYSARAQGVPSLNIEGIDSGDQGSVLGGLTIAIDSDRDLVEKRTEPTHTVHRDRTKHSQALLS